MKIVKTIIFVLFALVFITFGLDKFIHFVLVPELPADMQKVFDALMTLN